MIATGETANLAEGITDDTWPFFVIILYFDFYILLRDYFLTSFVNLFMTSKTA